MKIQHFSTYNRWRVTVGVACAALMVVAGVLFSFSQLHSVRAAGACQEGFYWSETAKACVAGTSGSDVTPSGSGCNHDPTSSWYDTCVGGAWEYYEYSGPTVSNGSGNTINVSECKAVGGYYRLGLMTYSRDYNGKVTITGRQANFWPVSRFVNMGGYTKLLAGYGVPWSEAEAAFQLAKDRGVAKTDWGNTSWFCSAKLDNGEASDFWSRSYVKAEADGAGPVNGTSDPDGETEVTLEVEVPEGQTKTVKIDFWHKMFYRDKDYPSLGMIAMEKLRDDYEIPEEELCTEYSVSTPIVPETDGGTFCRRDANDGNGKEVYRHENIEVEVSADDESQKICSTIEYDPKSLTTKPKPDGKGWKVEGQDNEDSEACVVIVVNGKKPEEPPEDDAHGFWSQSKVIYADGAAPDISAHELESAPSYEVDGSTATITLSTDYNQFNISFVHTLHAAADLCDPTVQGGAHGNDWEKDSMDSVSTAWIVQTKINYANGESKVIDLQEGEFSTSKCHGGMSTTITSGPHGIDIDPSDLEGDLGSANTITSEIVFSPTNYSFREIDHDTCIEDDDDDDEVSAVLPSDFILANISLDSQISRIEDVRRSLSPRTELTPGSPSDITKTEQTTGKNNNMNVCHKVGGDEPSSPEPCDGELVHEYYSYEVRVRCQSSSVIDYVKDEEGKEVLDENDEPIPIYEDVIERVTSGASKAGTKAQSVVYRPNISTGKIGEHQDIVYAGENSANSGVSNLFAWNNMSAKPLEVRRLSAYESVVYDVESAKQYQDHLAAGNIGKLKAMRGNRYQGDGVCGFLSGSHTVVFDDINIATMGPLQNRCVKLEGPDKTAQLGSSTSGTTVDFRQDLVIPDEIGNKICNSFGFMYEYWFRYDIDGEGVAKDAEGKVSKGEDVSGWQHESDKDYWEVFDSVCHSIAKKPSISILNGSLKTMGGINTSLSPRYDTPGLPQDVSTPSQVYGSWSEYLAVANGAISVRTNDNTHELVGGFTSGSALADGSTIVDNIKDNSLLTIANNADELGNAAIPTNKSYRIRIQSYFDTMCAQASSIGWSCERVSGTIGGNGSGTRILISNGNLTIGSDITTNTTVVPPASLGNLPNIYAIPHTVIIVKGDLTIAPNVEQINAILIVDGTINTCAEFAAGETMADTTSSHGNQCSKRLLFNGPVMAEKIELNRSYGADGTAYGFSTDASTPAETFNYGASDYFWGYAQSGRYDSSYTESYTRELAPRY